MAKKSPNPLAAAKNIVRGARNAREGLARARASLHPSVYPPFIEWLQSNPYVSSRALPSSTPKSVGDIQRVEALPSSDLAQALRWAGAILGAHAEHIARFVELSGALQRRLLVDDVDGALGQLNEIEQTLGHSYWAIKRRIPLLHYSKGIDAQKQYSRVIREKVGDRGPVAAIAYFTSVRTEPSVTPGRFYAQFHRDMAASAVRRPFYSFLAYHLTPSLRPDETALAEVLSVAESGSLIDYYEGFVAIARETAALSSELRPVAIATSRALLRRVHDPRVQNLVAVAEGGGVRLSPDSVQAAAAKLLAGDYDEAAVELLAYLKNHPTDVGALTLAARASAMRGSANTSGSPVLIERLVALLASVIRKDETAGDAGVALSKYSNAFDGDPWADTLYAIIERETRAQPEPSEHSFSHAAFLNGNSCSPLTIDFAPPGEWRRAFARGLANDQLPAPARGYVTALEDGGVDPTELGIAAPEAELLLARRASIEERFEDVIQIANAVGADTSPVLIAQHTRLVCWALYRAGRYDECAIRVAEVAIARPTWHELMPIGELARRYASGERVADRAITAVAIVFDLYTQHVSADLEGERVFILLDVLQNHGVAKPSELVSHQGGLSREHLVYIFRRVCVEGVLDRTGLFEGSQEIIEERLAICRQLVDLDPPNIDAYQTEIKALLRRLMIKKRMREVEQSRVYVDTDSIKRTVEDELREGFNRLVGLRSQPGMTMGLAEVRSALSKASAGDTSELESLTLPKDEKGQLVKGMILRLREEYMASPEHGLDKYLSVRIRHGALAAHLRRPAESANLVTRRAPGSGRYLRNSYWPERISGGDKELVDTLAARLARFSSDLDSFIESIRDWVKIRREGSSRGMFTYGIAEPTFRVIAGVAEEASTYEEFVDSVLAQFGSLLDLELADVRLRIETEGRRTLGALMSEFANDVERLQHRADVGDLLHAVRTAQVDLRTALDKAASWFVRARAASNEPFTLEEAVLVSAEAVKTLTRNIEPRFVYHGDATTKFHGVYFRAFVDVFFIILENVAKHSGLDAESDLIVVVVVKEGLLTVRVENNVARSANRPAQQTRVEQIRDAMRDERHFGSVSREGGTGLHKLRRILAHEFGSEEEFQFGFIDDTRFFIEFSLPVAFRTYEDPHS